MLTETRLKTLAALLLFALITPLRADVTAGDMAALKDDDFAKRVAVTRKLLADDTLTPQQIARAYQASSSAEAKHRLMTIARHHFVRRMREQEFGKEDPQRGALGLTHAPMTSDQMPELGKSAVIVKRTLPGFPAYATLEAGDLILAIDGEPIPPGITSDQITTMFGDRIQRIDAGKTAQFTILRDGKTLDVNVTTASHNALRLMYNTGGLEDRYQRAWLGFHDAMTKEEKER
ncbi:MAG: PDZ domain-containing protein [Phycisphaeraceae bacterium]